MLVLVTEEVAMLDEDNNKPDADDAIALSRRLFEVTAEHFPYPVLLARADVGEVLQLRAPAHEDASALHVLYRGQVAGAIVLHEHASLLPRMRDGQAFEAVVSENYQGRCRVLIRPASDSD